MPNNEWGDFQTPAELARAIMKTFESTPWTRVLEPTCGVGNFMAAVASLAPAEVIGLEINEAHAETASQFGDVLVENVFEFDFRKVPWRAGGPLLVVGNPPWVTNSQLSSLGSINLPEKVNLRGLKGMDALTGASNFDIAEYIWLKLIVELVDERPTIALLCKTHVARNVLSYCHQFQLPVANARLHQIDAKKWFGAAVDACVFSLEVGVENPDYRCELYPTLDAERERVFGFVGDLLVADVVAYERSRHADGACHLDWRQGLKHDAAPVMELSPSAERLVNKSGQLVDVEPQYLYPLAKSTDVFKGTLDTGRRVVVPQRSLGEETAHLASSAPLLWKYLTENDEVFGRRKSSIYVGKPRFSVFGIGEYTFAPYKVAISGLHKEPRFRMVGPIEGRAVILDDTCYFLPFEDPVSAAAAFALLTSAESLALVSSLAFWDAKRPVTKKLLQRIDLRALADVVSTTEVAASAGSALAGVGIDWEVDWEAAVDSLRWTKEIIGRPEIKALELR